MKKLVGWIYYLVNNIQIVEYFFITFRDLKTNMDWFKTLKILLNVHIIKTEKNQRNFETLRLTKSSSEYIKMLHVPIYTYVYV